MSNSIRRIDPNYKPVGRISSSSDPELELEEKHYCEPCRNVGVYSIMGPRVNYSAEDKDNWRQCYSCGRVVAIHEIKIEGKLQDVTETYDNPFSSNDGKIHGIGGERKFDITGKTQRKRKLKQGLFRIKDEDLRRELRKGSVKLISYSEKNIARLS